ncbi:MAG TPA: hypothetical protein VK968_01735, partial [Roseimicrobium sp.]|nr:hypothetical protein [Roseimicrobium sp.]
GLDGVLEDAMFGFSMDVGDEANTTGIVLKFGAVQRVGNLRIHSYILLLNQTAETYQKHPQLQKIFAFLMNLFPFSPV